MVAIASFRNRAVCVPCLIACCWIGAGCAAGAGGSGGGAALGAAGTSDASTGVSTSGAPGSGEDGDAGAGSASEDGAAPTVDDAAADDAAADDAAADDAAASASQCVVGPLATDITCNHQAATIGGRSVLWETPLGTPPAGGWPVVILFQGSLMDPAGNTVVAPHGAWAVESTDAALDGVFSDYVLAQLVTQITVIKTLLDNGYAVITPTADGDGFAWDTNFPPWSISWSGAPDDVFLKALFAEIDGSQLGQLSTSDWYATGVSSGGYMTSRMAVSYQGRFLALAIAAGSYATCVGGVSSCTVPALPANHPPTLFMHGGDDPFVPIAQMWDYFDALSAGGFTTHAVVDPTMAHGWVPTAPSDVLAWFQAH
jgi:poly(3-hydroxyoctanoate) depolymerase